MTTTKLDDLQQQVAEALGSGMTPADVRDKFALTSTSFENWRRDAAFVAEVERVRAQSLNPSNADNFSELDAALGEQLTEGAACDELHDQKNLPARGGEVVDVYQIRVAELGHRARLAPEPIAEDIVVDELFVHHFRRDLTAQPGVHAAVDGGHAAARDRAVDDVAPVQRRACT